LLLLIFSNAQAQKFIDLFKNELPNKLIENNAYKKQAELELTHILKIHPHLIYYYFQYLDSLLTTKNIVPGRNQRESSKYLTVRKYYSYRNSLWLSEEYALLEKAEPNFSQPRKFFENFNLDNNIMGYKEEAFDNNLRSYFAYKFYTKDTLLEYSAKIDYEDLSYKTQKGMYEELLKTADFFDDLSNINQIKFVESCVENWYLFTEMFSYKNSEKIKPYQFAIKCYSIEIENYNEILASVFLSEYMNPIIHYDDTYVLEEYMQEDLTTPALFEFPIKISSMPYLSIGLGYKITTKEASKMFSHISIKGYYTFMETSVDMESLNSTFFVYTIRALPPDFIGGDTSKREIMVYNSSATKPKALSGYFEILTPLYFLTDRIYAEIGGALEIDYVSFELNFQKTFMVVSGYGKDLKIIASSYPEKFKNYSYSKFNYHPFFVMSLVYGVKSNIETRFNVYVGSNTVLRLGLDLKF